MPIRSTLPSPFRRAVAAAVAAALLLPAVGSPAAQARPAVANKAVKAAAGEATDFSARRKVRRHYRGNAAGAAMMGMTLGVMGAIIAEQRRRDYYRHRYYYGGGPYYGGYYYGGPSYYGGGPYYPVPHY